MTRFCIYVTVVCLLRMLPSAAWPQTSGATRIERQSREVVQHATDLRASHQEKEAAQVLADFLAKHPDDADALTAMARIRLDAGDVEEARKLLTEALHSSPNSVGANNLLGSLLLSQKRYPEAMDHFETVLKISLRDDTARQGELAAATQLAIESRRQGNQDAALKCLEHAREYLPDDAALLTDLGIQAQQMHLGDRAEEALKAALKLKPGDPAALYALARVELDEDRLPSAETHLRAYLATSPNDASAHYGLGRLLDRELRVDEAKTELERSIALQPVQTESYYELGQIALDGQHDAEAKPLFLKALARNPNHGGALAGMGILAYRAKDYVGAERYLAQAVVNAATYQPAHYYYGLTLARLGKKEQSERELKIAISLQPSHALPKPLDEH
jgi:tetratricopeptide (TPR) repeat protein